MADNDRPEDHRTADDNKNKNLDIESDGSNSEFDNDSDGSVSSMDAAIGQQNTMEDEIEEEEQVDLQETPKTAQDQAATKTTRTIENIDWSSTPLNNAATVRNRCIITVLHFILTYPQWSIMLFLAFAMLTSPLSTVDEQVTYPINDLKSLLETESNMYHESVATGFKFSDYHMNNAIMKEEQRINEIKIKNQAMLQKASVVSSQCHNSTVTAQRALQSWYALSDIPVPRKIRSTVNDNETATQGSAVCTIQDQDRLRTILKEDFKNAQDNVKNLLNDYVSETLSSIQKVVDYSQARSAYDYDYFIGMKMLSTINLLDGMTAPTIHLTMPEQDITIELRNILVGIIEAFKAAHVQIDLLNARLLEFKASIEGFYINYIDLYSRFQLITVFVRDFLPGSVQLPSYFDISGLPTADFLLPQIFDVPKFNMDIPEIDLIVSDVVQQAIELMTKILLDAAEDLTEQMQAIVEQTIASLHELLTLEDYDPPRYPVSASNPQVRNPAGEITYMNELADKIKASTDAALRKAQGQLQDSVPYEEPAIPEINPTGADLNDGGLTKFSFLETSLPELDIPLWFIKGLGWLCSRSLFVECFLQFIRLWRLKRKYERNAQPKLPEIDYLVNDSTLENQEDSGGASRTLDLIRISLCTYLMNPWAIVAAMSFPIILAVLVFWFPHVKDTCVDSRRGTFVARHVLTPVLVNKANVKGNSLYTDFMLSCQRKNLSVCVQKRSETSSTYQKDTAMHSSYKIRYSESVDVLGTLNRCVDTDWLDKEFNTHCCGLEGYTIDGQNCSTAQVTEMCPMDGLTVPPSSFSPIGETITNPACYYNFEDFILEDSTFACESLDDTCKAVAYSGVDKDLILQMTIDADCSAEVYVIQMCIFVALVLYHAIMVNIINTLLFNGILCLSWRKMRPDGIKMVTHVNEANGKILKGASRKERLSRITEALHLYERLGRVQIALCAFIFGVWLASFFVLNRIASSFSMHH